MSSNSISDRPRKASPLRIKLVELAQSCRRLANSYFQAAEQTDAPARSFRAVTDEANDLIKKGDPHLVALGEIGKRVKARLDSCTTAAPCGVIGCAKCTRRRVLERTNKICNQALAFRTKYPRSMLIVIGIGSRNWQGDIDFAKIAMSDDLKALTTRVFRRMSILKGYALHIDAKPMIGDNHLEMYGRSNVDQREMTGWHMHIHGTLAVTGEGTERLETVRKQLNELCGIFNLELEFHLEELKPTKSKIDLPAETPVIKVDKYHIHSLANYVRYAQKTLIGESKLNDDKVISAEGVRVLQRHLLGYRMEWAGGVLAQADSPLKPIEDARGCVRWIEDLQRLFGDLRANPEGLDIDAIDVGMLERNVKDLDRGLGYAKELLRHSICQRNSFVRQKRRRRRSIAKLRSKYTGNLLRLEIEKVNRRHARDRHKQRDARARRQDIIDALWYDVKDAIARVFRRTTRIIAGMNPAELNRRVMLAELTESTRLQSAIQEIAAAGMIYSVRRKIRDLTTGAKYLNRQGVTDGTAQHAIERAVELSFSLERWNAVWPCWLTDENIQKLDWERWWSHWHERHFIRVCAG